MIRLHGVGRRHPRWLVVIIAVKVLIIAGFVILPAAFAVSLGVAHGVVLAVSAVVVATGLVIKWRRRSGRPVQTDHGHGHGHDHGHRTETVTEGKDR